jgi:tetratricopeptide (TPR) repeat protein
LEKLGDAGMNTSSEVSQFQTVTSQFIKKRKAYLRQVGGKKALEAFRNNHHPQEQNWWWFVDHRIENEKMRKFRKGMYILSGLSGLIILCAIIYNKCFAPEPHVIESYTLKLSVETALLDGDLEYALDQVQHAIELTPDDPNLYVLEGVTLTELDRMEEAKTSFTQAEIGFQKIDQFYNERTRVYLLLGKIEDAFADIEKSFQINPDSAVTYLYRGQAYDAAGEYQAAVDSYTIADRLAEQDGDIRLQAVIRVNLSNTYQKASLPGNEAGEEDN